MPVYNPDTSGAGVKARPRGNEAMEAAQATPGQPGYPMPQPAYGPGSNGAPNPAAGAVGTYYSSPGQGLVSPYTPNPNLVSNLYQTGTGSGTPGQAGYTPPATNVSGQGTLSQGSYEQQQQDQLRAQLSQQAFASRLALLEKTGGGPAAHVEMGMGPEESAARAAAFARAKEQAGGTALAAMRGLQDSMASRGLSGSLGRGLEGGGINNIIGGAAGGVNDFTREQLIQDLNRYSNIANTKYQGDITQRGQDLSSRNAILGLLSSGGGLF